MLYDPKWGQPSLKPSLEGLIAWLERQPADEAYCIALFRECVMGQYHHSIGAEPPVALGKGWMAEVSFAQPYTFGAALERARQPHVLEMAREEAQGWVYG
jgi:hypothetical protein